jgi:hypothetical protein
VVYLLEIVAILEHLSAAIASTFLCMKRKKSSTTNYNWPRLWSRLALIWNTIRGYCLKIAQVKSLIGDTMLRLVAAHLVVARLFNDKSRDHS